MMGVQLVILAVTVVGLYLLWINGWLTVKYSIAVMFTGRMTGSSASRARFSRCSGSIKRVIKLEKGREYLFSLTPELTKGEMSVELLDMQKRTVICLDQSLQSASCIAREKRGYLLFRFRRASGSFSLTWEQF